MKIKTYSRNLSLLFLGSCLLISIINWSLSVCAQTNAEGRLLKWTDVKEFEIQGKGWTDTKNFYDRLPSKAEGKVTDAVWNLSHDSAGICVHFMTDATELSARWTVRKAKLALSHMPASGVSGVDLYTRFKGRWVWLGAARPDESMTTEKRLTTGMTSEWRECMLYLPLYNGVEKLELGVPENAHFKRPPERPASMKPVVFYGTSVLQGGCASRPGMAYPSILGRRLDWSIINLGFSGNAHCEPEIAALLAELDPQVYVLDPLPNMNYESVAERMPVMLDKLRAAHPMTPIVLVEHIEVGDAQVVPSRRGYAKSNDELHRIYEIRVRAGDKKLFYVNGAKLLGDDGQGTVDRVHPTDLGFMRMSDGIEPVLKRAIRASR